MTMKRKHFIRDDEMIHIIQFIFEHVSAIVFSTGKAHGGLVMH